MAQKCPHPKKSAAGKICSGNVLIQFSARCTSWQATPLSLLLLCVTSFTFLRSESALLLCKSWHLLATKSLQPAFVEETCKITSVSQLIKSCAGIGLDKGNVQPSLDSGNVGKKGE